MSKFKGNGFTYWLDNNQLKDFDDFEKKTKNLEVSIKVEKLNVYATSNNNN